MPEDECMQQGDALYATVDNDSLLSVSLHEINMQTTEDDMIYDAPLYEPCDFAHVTTKQINANEQSNYKSLCKTTQCRLYEYDDIGQNNAQSILVSATSTPPLMPQKWQPNVYLNATGESQIRHSSITPLDSVYYDDPNYGDSNAYNDLRW